jgi:hypothetical protein
MKHSLLIAAVILAMHVAHAQCGFFPMKEAGVYTYAMYDHKDKPSGTLNYNFKNVSTVAGETKADVDMVVKDDKGKDITKSSAQYRCTAEKFMVDMKSSVAPAQTEAFKNMEMRGEAAYIEYPSNLSVNSQLPDGNMHLDVYNEGQPYGTMDMEVYERRVEAQENVSTPAGSFDAYRIRSTMRTKVQLMGIGFPMETQTVEWYAKGTGLVKQESYNKNGKKVSSVILTSVK